MTALLRDIEPGAQLRVLALREEAHKKTYVQQLMRLGLTPGTTFRVVRHAPMGDPIEIRVRGYSLALRPEEADVIEVEVIE